MPRKRVCVVTGARSEYGLLRWVMEEIRSSASLELRVAVTGSHLLAEYGETWREIEADGLPVDEKVPAPLDPGRPAALAAALGDWGKGFAAAFERLAPDCVLVMGDRYELLPVASACTVMGIPLAHVSGGEITQGAVDDQIRHATTKLAHLHFAANAAYAARLLQMGEEPWRVRVSGEPGLDNMRRLPLLSRAEVEAALELDLSKPTALVAFHPVTHELAALDEQVAELAAALDASGLPCVLTYPNADAGSDRVISAWRALAARRPDFRLRRSLGQRLFLSLMRQAALMIGNSSSALVEAPFFRLPAVNIGARQGGRMRAANVIDCGHGRAEIAAAVRAALAFDRSRPCENPYGDGRSSRRVRVALEEVLSARPRAEILRKSFVDLPGAGPRPSRVGGDFAVDLRPLAGPRGPLAPALAAGPRRALAASGRAAFRLCLDDARLRGRAVLLPDFLCAEALLPAARAAGTRPRFYPVGRDLRPDLPRLLELAGRAAAVLLIDYFGFGESEAWARELRRARPRTVLLSDWVQALDLLRGIGPVRQAADYAFASLRKSLPVPDGAVVRSRRPLRVRALPAAAGAGLSALAAGALKREFLEGRADPEAEAAYLRLFAEARRELSCEPRGASSLSLDLAARLPVEDYAAARRANYAALARALSGSRLARPLRPALEPRAVPLFLPVTVAEGRRDALRAFLRERGIYAPVHWTLPAALARGDAGRLSREILSLPVDQRCGPPEVARVAESVLAFERGAA